MFDLSEPIGWPAIVTTIAAIFAVTGLGIVWVKRRCGKKSES